MLNGGLASLEQARPHVERGLDGVMLGRAAYHEPAILGRADRLLFDAEAAEVSPEAAVRAYRPYIAAELARGTHLYAIVRHMLGLFGGMPGARGWRRHLSTEGVKRGAGIEVLRDAVRLVRPAEVAAAY